MFWKGVKSVGQPVDIMVPPHLQNDLIQSLSARENMSVSVFVEDVQKLVEKEAATILGPGLRLDWNSYGTLDAVSKGVILEIWEYFVK